MAATILVLYPDNEGARFDLDYYMTKHMPLVGEKFTPFGLKQWRVMRSAGTLDGGRSVYRMAAVLEFGSADQFRAAAAAEGPSIFGYVPNYTDIKPVLMISELVGAS